MTQRKLANMFIVQMKGTSSMFRNSVCVRVGSEGGYIVVVSMYFRCWTKIFFQKLVHRMKLELR